MLLARQFQYLLLESVYLIPSDVPVPRSRSSKYAVRRALESGRRCLRSVDIALVLAKYPSSEQLMIVYMKLIVVKEG